MKFFTILFTMLFLLAGCGQKTTEQAPVAQVPAVEEVQSVDENWEFPTYEMEKTTLYDANGVLLTVDAIQQSEQDPSCFKFVYTLVNNNDFSIQFYAEDLVINGYSWEWSMFDGAVKARESRIAELTPTLQVPRGSEEIVVQMYGVWLKNLSRAEILDENMIFTLCTKGADENQTYIYPSGKILVHQNGVRIESLGHIYDEPRSVAFLIVNEREEPIEGVSIKPTSINGIDVTNAEHNPTYFDDTSVLQPGTAYILEEALNQDFVQECSIANNPIPQIDTMTVDITVEGNDCFEVLGVTVE